jgi:thiol-disulfide isomerase/thioredoxin
MRIRIGLRITLVAGAVLLAACGGGSDRGVSPRPDGSAGARSGLYAEPFPLDPIAMVDLDGHDRSTATWGGRIVVINVWATWCGPCRREMPFLQEIQQKHADRLLLIGLLQDQVTTPFAIEFLRSAKVSYPVVRSTIEIESKLPAIMMLPMTYVIDGRGRLVAAYAGELEAPAFESDLATLLSRDAAGDR